MTEQSAVGHPALRVVAVAVPDRVRGNLSMSDRASRYGMILLDADPVVLCVRGQPIIFRSADETVEYARLHHVQRWMVFGDPEGWWPLYTQDGPVNPPPPAKERVDISLTRDRKS